MALPFAMAFWVLLLGLLSSPVWLQPKEACPASASVSYSATQQEHQAMICHSQKIVIVGGGIAGSAAAIAVKTAGVQVELVEKRVEGPYQASTGTMLNLGSAAMGAIKRMSPSLYARVRAKCSQVGDQPVLYLADFSAEGLPLFNVNIHRKTGQLWSDKCGWERACVIKRADLHQSLYDTMADMGVTVHLNATFSHYEQSLDGVIVHLRHGQVLHASALLACDGVHSRVRKQMWKGRESQAVPQYTWVYGSFDGDWRKHFGLHAASSNKIAVGYGDGPRALWFFATEPSLNNRDGGHLEWGALHPRGLAQHVKVGEASGAGRSGLEVSVAELRAAYGSGLFGEMAAVLPKDYGQVLDAYATYVVPEGPWTQGNVMLLGDAAHGISNVIALGASLAIEDAHRFGVEIAFAFSIEERGQNCQDLVQLAFHRTEAKRRPRVESTRSEALRRQTTLLSGSLVQYYLTRFIFNGIMWLLNPVPTTMFDTMQSCPGGSSLSQEDCLLGDVQQ